MGSSSTGGLATGSAKPGSGDGGDPGESTGGTAIRSSRMERRWGREATCTDSTLPEALGLGSARRTSEENIAQHMIM